MRRVLSICLLGAVFGHALAASEAVRPSEMSGLDWGLRAFEQGDYKLALARWSALGDNASPDVAYNIGQLYRLGLGVERDLSTAASFYRRAADAGHVQAQGNLGALLLDDRYRGRDPYAAMAWLRKAAHGGNANSQYLLGYLLSRGEDVEKDPVEGYAWLRLSESRKFSGAGDLANELEHSMIPSLLAAAEARLDQLFRSVPVAPDAPAGPVAPDSPPVAPDSPSPPEVPVTPSVVAPTAPTTRLTPPEAAEAKTEAGLPDVSRVVTSDASPGVGDYAVQLAALSSDAVAREHWQQLTRRHAQLLGGMSPEVQLARLADGKTFYRLRTGRFADRGAAAGFCDRLAAAALPCIVVRRGP